MRCEYCGSNLHTITNCPKTASGQGNRNRMRCVYCGSRDHNIEAFPKTWGGNAAIAWRPETVKDYFVKDR
jgi:hypothetical protein